MRALGDRAPDLVPGIPHFVPPRVLPPRFDLRRYREVPQEIQKQKERDSRIRHGLPVVPINRMKRYRFKKKDEEPRDENVQERDEQYGRELTRPTITLRLLTRQVIDRIVERHLRRGVRATLATPDV